MNRIILISLFGLMCLSLAQELDISYRGWSDEAKNIFYQTEKISPEKAVLYQLSNPLPFINLGFM